ncbi:hypothetical protein WS86_27090 [Burkholderia savannae]|uniref:Uncharacterized protein n=1 Tax=Burkholderia savannae TaxID=1637837 RepID=A0ABR5T3P2_9BURK|nr:hypothetical protein WS86_27090 [Burkholderia savannae]KWZ37825.1 hypothetical protein WS72_23115 [Burkholderia savannae]KWZ48141.1 hypothetical protein WS73_06390 [Burkholderia savannae]
MRRRHAAISRSGRYVDLHLSSATIRRVDDQDNEPNATRAVDAFRFKASSRPFPGSPRSRHAAGLAVISPSG